MSFFEQYFVAPIYSPQGTYNIFNTVTYAIIAIAALFAIYKILQKIKFRADSKFFYALFPFIVLGASLRAFVDAGLYKISFWTVSPGIYILIAGVFLAIFFASLWFQKRSGAAYWKTTLSVGMAILLIHFGMAATKLHVSNLVFGLLVAGLASVVSIVLFYVFKLVNFKAGLKLFWPFPAHMLDASATFIAVDFLGATEKHPLPFLATSFMGTAAVMFVLKLLVLIPLVYFLGKELKDENLACYLAISLAVLGFAQGIRNLLVIIL